MSLMYVCDICLIGTGTLVRALRTQMRMYKKSARVCQMQ